MALPHPRASWPDLLVIIPEAMSRMQERLSRADQDPPTRFHEIRFGDALVRKVHVTEDGSSHNLVFPPWEASQAAGDRGRSPSSARPRVGLDILINGEMTLDHVGSQFASHRNARSDPISGMMTPLIRTYVALEYMWQASTEAFCDIQTAVDSLPLDTWVTLSSDLPANQRILFSTLEAVDAGLVSTRLDPDDVNAEAMASRRNLGLDEEQVNWTLPEARNTALIKWNAGKCSLPFRIDFHPSLPWMHSMLDAMGISEEADTLSSSQMEEICASSPEEGV
jgi:hypothetical protein